MSALHLIARIAGRPVAFASARVESVVDVETVVPAPRAEPGVVGITALRSRVVTVIDPGAMLGEAPVPGGTRRAVVTIVDGHFYAILVESLSDVGAHESTPTPAGIALAPGWARAARGMIDLDGVPVLVLDPAALVPHAQLPVAA